MKFKVVDINHKELSEESVSIKKDSNNDTAEYAINRYVKCKSRAGTAATKTRGKVKCSTAKAYKQKGTGNARRGAKSSPLIRGGGVIFGPEYRSYKFKLNKKYIKIALTSIFSKISSNLVVIDVENNKDLKTKQAIEFVSKIGAKSSTVLIVDVSEYRLIKAFSNYSSVKLIDINNIDPQTVLASEKVIISKLAFDKYKGLIS